MNEITQIHLGRQPFTIAVDAHRELREYLAAIRHQVDDKEVVDEVELRMAELLTERGITGDKVILQSDVEYLKEQLGSPKDFKEGAEADESEETSTSRKRLFRDTDTAIIAGVASGLANYFGIDVLLIRLLFILGAFAGGWGILLYIVLWLLMPEAKTTSDRLQMQGMPVTVESLKAIAERADLGGAARRANNTIVPIINTTFRLIAKVLGIAFIVAGVSVLFSLVAVYVYMALHNGQLFQEDLFPVGTLEHVLFGVAILLVAIVALFSILTGLAFAKNRWPIHTWLTSSLVGLFLIGLAAGIGLAGDVAPTVVNRYYASLHSTTRTMQPFTDVNVVDGEQLHVEYQYADTYSVAFQYYGSPDVAKITTKVVNGTLVIDSEQFDWHRSCSMLCMFPTYNLVVIVRGPNAPSITYPMPPMFPVRALRVLPGPDHLKP